MNWFESILYGLISGITEFLPISSNAHQAIAMQFFGAPEPDPVRTLLVHIAVLLSLYMGCRSLIQALQRDSSIVSQMGHSARKNRSIRGVLDIRLIKSAAVPMLIGLLLLFVTKKLETNLVVISFFLLINGVLLFIPERMTSGNKDARSMSRLDGILMGLSAALSVFPGISRIGAITTTATVRGAEKQHALNWALLLSIPALAMVIGFDFLSLFTQGIAEGFLQNLLGYLLSGLAAYAGGYIGMYFAKILIQRSGFAGLAYYSWGAGLFLFILYLQI